MASEQPERSRAKTRITIRIDGGILEWFRKQVATGGGNYQTLVNDALREHVTRREGTLAETLRRVVRQELAREQRRTAAAAKKAKKSKPRKARRKVRTRVRGRVRVRSRKKASRKRFRRRQK